jgi:hypothetical protein
MNPSCLGADLLDTEPTLARLLCGKRRLRIGSLGTVTPADFGFTIRDFAFDIGIYYRRSVADIPRLHSCEVKKARTLPLELTAFYKQLILADAKPSIGA